jgi:hypothetical protein
VRVLLKLAKHLRLETAISHRVLYQPTCSLGFRQDDNAQRLLAKQLYACGVLSRPKPLSFLFTQRITGGMIAAIAPFAKSCGSVVPVEYTAISAPTSDRA